MRKSLIDKGYDSLVVEDAINEIIIKIKVEELNEKFFGDINIF